MSTDSRRTERLKPYERRIPTKFEKNFSLGVVALVTLLGMLILLGIFRIDPKFKVYLGMILLGYGLIRFWMIRSRYRKMESKEDNVKEPTKEEEKNLRN